MSFYQQHRIQTLLRQLRKRTVLARDVHQSILSAPHYWLTTVDRRSGDLPLHGAVKLLDPRNTPENEIVQWLPIVRVLAERAPHAISQQNKKGKTPIHLLIGKGLDPATILSFARLNPDALSKKDSYGDTPLHRACYERAGDIAVAIELSRMDPYQLACLNHAGYTPAHLLCSERPREVQHFMENVFPPNVPMIQGIHVDELLPRLFCNHNRDGEYPLHTFLRKGGIGSDSMASQLLRWYPIAASKKSKIDGAYPLHLASRFHAYSPNLLSELVRVCGGALRIRDKNGQYPIHHLFQFGPRGLVSSETYDHDVSVYQLLPMQVVKRRILETFIARFPESLGIADIYGRIPYDYAKRMERIVPRTPQLTQILSIVAPRRAQDPETNQL